MQSLTLSSVMLVYNDLDVITQSAPWVQSYSDQCIFVDQGSTDGTLQFLSKSLRPQDCIVSVDWRVLYREGFAGLRNIGARMAKGSWVECVDSDEYLAPESRAQLRKVLSEADASVISVSRRNFHFDANLETSYWPHIARDAAFDDEPGQRRFYRPGQDLRWEGYIHEEIWEGCQSAYFTACNSSLNYWHFTNYRMNANLQLRHRRYAWMLLNAYNNPPLQFGTNHEWYDKVVPADLESIRQQASDLNNTCSRMDIIYSFQCSRLDRET